MNVCMLVYNFYETDLRVMRYAESLAQRGDHVDVFALRNEGQPYNELYRGVNVYRIQKCVSKDTRRLLYLLKLLIFLMHSCISLSVKHLKKPYSLIHVHSVPDFEVFAAFFAKLTGAKIILDIHDIVPEFYANKFNTSHKSIIFKLLALTEKICIAFSDHVIISNHLWEKTLLSRSVKEGKCTTCLNYVDSSIFFRRSRTRSDDRFIIIYPGSINLHQGLDIAVKAFSLIAEKVPEAELHIYGEGSGRQFVEELVNKLGLRNRVFILNSVPAEQIAEIIADSDLGIVPKRDDSFGGEAFSTKIFEFMSLGVPVIVADTKIDRYYFNDSVVKFFKAGNEQSLAQSLLEIINDPGQRKILVNNAFAFIENYTWEKNKKDYFDLVDSLTGKK